MESDTLAVHVNTIMEPGSNGVLTYFIGYSQNGTTCSSTIGRVVGVQYLLLMVSTQGDALMRVTQMAVFIGAVGGNGGDGGTITKTYDADNNVLDEQGGPSEDVECTYGQIGNVLTQQYNGYSALDTTQYYNASQYFQKQSETDMNGHTSTYGVGTDTAGNTGDPDSNIGDRGEVLWERDAGYSDTASPSYGKQYSYTYNQYGQMLTSADLKGTVTQNIYGTGDDTVDGYYDLGRIIQVVEDPGTGHLDRTTSMHYDACGRVIQSTDPLGQTTNCTYNVLGQPLTVTTPARGSSPAETVSYVYGADGRPHSVTDNRGTTVITYEDEHYNDYTNYSGRVYSVSDPVTGTITYSYLITGEKSTVSLPGGRIWTYNYQSDNDEGDNYVISKDDPDSVTRLLVSIQDNQGRLINVVGDLYGDNGVTQFNFTYNSSGTAVSLTDTQNVLDNGYGPWLKLLSQSVWSPIDVRGELVQRSTTAYQYSTANAAFVGQTLCSNNYTYDNAGNRLTNTVATATVNSSGAVQYQGGTSTLGSALTGPNSNSRYYPFTYLPVSNELSTTRTETYSYDDLSRLSTVNYGDGETQSYAFDAMGNRLSRTDTVTPQSGGATTTTTASTFDAANRITGVSTNGGTGAAITSDADGNTLTDAIGRSYTWDSKNRMTSCTYNGTITTFTYGADGLRRSMTVNGVTTCYGYDGTMLAQEYKVNAQTGSLAATATYMPGPSGPSCRVDETNQTEGYYPAGITSTAPLGRGVTHWYVYDGLGSVIGELDDNNNLTTSKQYDVYGAPKASTLQGGAATSPQGYVGSLGHVTDAGTGGLIYMQARYYDPSVGRFVSEDPGANGTNWYIYALDSPTDFVDSTGKAAEPFSEAVMSEKLQIAISYLQIMAPIDEDTTLIKSDIWAVKFSGPNFSLQAIADVLLEQSEELLVWSHNFGDTAIEMAALGGAEIATEQEGACAEASEGLRDLRAMMFIDNPDLSDSGTF